MISRLTLHAQYQSTMQRAVQTFEACAEHIGWKVPPGFFNSAHDDLVLLTESMAEAEREATEALEAEIRPAEASPVATTAPATSGKEARTIYRNRCILTACGVFRP